jgi:hypothetical protein
MTTTMDLKIPAAIAMAAALLTGGRISAQEPAPPGTNLADFAARRHPQPVRVGDLIQRRVLQPLESRPVLGHVTQVVRRSDGTELIVMKYGGWWGFGGRVIAVPVPAMALLGAELEILDFTPDQLAKFPTYDGAGVTPVPPDAFIRMGLAHPSH